MLPLSPYRVLLVLTGSGTNAAIAAFVLLAAAFAAVWADRHWTTLFLLATVVCLFVEAFGHVAIGFAFTHGWLRRFALLNGCLVSPTIATPLGIAALVSYLLPIALVLWIVRIRRKGLT